MTTPIAPTNGAMAMRISERPARRQSEGGHAGGDPQQGDHTEPQPPPSPEPAEPAIDEDVVPAETLFAAKLMGESLAPHPTPGEIRKPAGTPAWEPPESGLHLTDKKI